MGDSWHGQDWVYDETNFKLGLPTSNATLVRVTNSHPPPVLPAVPLTQQWSLYVRPDSGNGSWSLDSVVPPIASPPRSALIVVEAQAHRADGIDLSQTVQYEDGNYQLSFYAKASEDATPLTLNSRKFGGDWHNFGLDHPMTLSTSWVQYNVTFTSTSDGTAGKLSFFVGEAAAGTKVWINSPRLFGTAPVPQVLRRDFECGTVVLNGDVQTQTVDLGSAAGLHRLDGKQAPMWQYTVDDNSSSFQRLSGEWRSQEFDNGYRTATQEEVRPPNGYWHHWEKGAHIATAGSSAQFDLQVSSAKCGCSCTTIFEQHCEDVPLALVL